jgi:hypothetical protein
VDLEQHSLALLRNMQQYQGTALAAYKQNAEQLSLVRLSPKVVSHFVSLFKRGNVLNGS